VKKLILRGANKKIRNNLSLTPYDLSVNLQYKEIERILRTRSCFRKYICLSTELSEFKIKRNDRYLVLIMLFIILTKSYFMVSLLIYLFTANHAAEKESVINDVIHCIGIYVYLTQ
jgi:hypothetical protein